MSTAEIVEKLKEMSDEEYRAVIEAADRLRLASRPPRSTDPDDDPILRVAGSLSGEPTSSREIDSVVYDPQPG